VPVGDGQSTVVADLLTSALDRDDPNHPLQPQESCFTDLGAATDQIADDDVFEGLDGRSHVILITDGLAGYEYAVNDIQQLHDREIATFVVGFGQNVNAETLSELGMAGGVPASASTPYYRAGLDDLGRALSEVLQGLQCWYSFEVPEEDRDRLEVTFDGAPVAFDPSGNEGWRYADGTDAVVFSGQACDQLLTREVVSVELSLRCG
ncbi:MAG: VWA domain-containing protein, partial [Deltaproteobacteria bacterium]|nr:VWA domain-containing protein [Deltaproteobacteria bacterium]